MMTMRTQNIENETDISLSKESIYTEVWKEIFYDYY